jgi:hypothetical protein
MSEWPTCPKCNTTHDPRFCEFADIPPEFRRMSRLQLEQLAASGMTVIELDASGCNLFIRDDGESKVLSFHSMREFGPTNGVEVTLAPDQREKLIKALK